jgi:hypothetical protein
LWVDHWVVSTVLLTVQNQPGLPDSWVWDFWILRDKRSFKRVITGPLAVIAIGFVAGLFNSPPSIVMDGLLRRRIPLPFRRVVTLIPALVVLAINPTP